MLTEKLFQRLPGAKRPAIPLNCRIARISDLAGSPVLLGRFCFGNQWKVRNQHQREEYRWGAWFVSHECGKGETCTYVKRLAPFDKLRVLSPIEGRVAYLAGFVSPSRVSRKSRFSSEIRFTNDAS